MPTNDKTNGANDPIPTHEAMARDQPTVEANEKSQRSHHRLLDKTPPTF
jgi:hypothetical protein